MSADPVNSHGRPDWLSLRTIFLLSAGGYGLLALWFPLIRHVDRTPPGDIRTFAPTPLGGLAYSLLIIVLFALLVAAFRRAEESSPAKLTLPCVLAGSLVLALPLLLGYPINATDIFGYVIRGRIASAYGESPFTSPAAAFVGDPFMPLVGEWAGQTTPYGPLWEIIAAGLTAVSGGSLLWGVWLFKGLALLSFLITTTLIWHVLPDNHRRSPYTLLWAWNPGLLLTFILNGHNDALMMLWLVMGFAVACRGRPSAGFVIMVLAVLTKPVAVLALPFFFIEFWRELPAGRPRARFMALTVAGSLFAAWLAFLPWVGESGLLRTPVDLALRLMDEATGGAGFSPAVWVYMALGGRAAIETIGLVLSMFFVVIALGLVWLAVRGRPAVRGAADIFFGYLATALNFRIWYAAWPFPWLLLDAGRRADSVSVTGAGRVDYRLRVGLWFLLMAQLSVVIYGHLRVYALGGDQATAHLIGVPLVFGAPWLLALLPVRLSRAVHGA